MALFPSFAVIRVYKPNGGRKEILIKLAILVNKT
jgi:hypothetical protein